MKKIIVIGDKYNEFAKNLCLILKEYVQILLITSQSITDYSINDVDYLVCSLDNSTDIHTDNAIIFFVDKFEKANNNNLFTKNNHAIYFEHSMKYGYNNEITIGHTEESDVIISSCNEDNICISINHTIVTLKRKEIVPCDVKITINKYCSIDKSAIISAAIVLLLTDKTDNKKLEFTF